MHKPILAFLVTLCAASSMLAAEQPQQLWLYYATNFQANESMPKIDAIWRRAAKAGYSHVLLTDSKFAKLGDLGGMEKQYFGNVEKAKKLVTKRVSGLEKAALRGISDSLRDRLGSGIVVLASENDGKVGLVVSVSKDLTAKIQAGRIVKELAPIVGGGGGGRPDFAEAGGKDPSRIGELLSKAPEVVRALLG